MLRRSKTSQRDCFPKPVLPRDLSQFSRSNLRVFLVSWRASAFVKPLTHHQDGTPLTAREKLILFVLADSHNDDYDCAWPGLTKASQQALTSRRRFIDLIKRLEDHGTITVERREGRSNLYRFSALVQPLHPPTPKGVKGLHPTSATATARGGATATAPEPSLSPQVANIRPLPAALISQAIEQSRKTGRSADDILNELRSDSAPQ
jgi:hypothetical protein